MHAFERAEARLVCELRDIDRVLPSEPCLTNEVQPLGPHNVHMKAHRALVLFRARLTRDEVRDFACEIFVHARSELLGNVDKLTLHEKLHVPFRL